MNTFDRRLGGLLLGLLAACGSHGGNDGGSISQVEPPSNLAYPGDPSVYIVDIAAAANVPSFSGSVDQFSIDPPLPSGLVINSASGAISGTPAAPAPRTVHMVKAQNAGGSVQFPLRITVVAPPRFAYSISEDSTISMFSADPVTGHLQRKGYIVAAAAESGPERLVVHPSFKFLYVPNADTNNLSVYAIDPASGWLTPAAPAAAGSGPHRMVIDPTGRFAYVSNRGSDQIRVYSINASNGALTALGAPVAAGTQPSALALDPTGKWLFVALRGDPSTGAGSALAVFAVDLASGAITPAGSSLALGNSKPIGLALEPGLDVVYAIQEAAGSTAAVHFDPTSGALSAIGAQSLGLQPSDVSEHPTGKFAYASAFAPVTQAGSVAIFGVDAASGALVPAGSAATGLQPSSVTVDPSGQFAYVTGHESSDISAYSIDTHSGALTLIDSVLTRVGPIDFVLVQGPHVQSWTPRFVHVTNSGSDDVSAFRIDAATGALTSVGPAVPAGTAPISLGTDPRQRFVYVANAGSNDVGLYLLSPSSGALFEVTPRTPVIGHPTHLTVDPSGRFLYVTAEGQVDPNAGWVTTFGVHPTLGTLTLLDTQPLTTRPAWVTTDPTGQNLYVANSGNGQPGTGVVAAFRLPATTGIPVGMGTSPSPGIHGLGCHPNGKFIYAMLKHSDAMIEFTIDASNGALTLFPAVARAGLEPSSVSVTPDGRFAYVAFVNSIDVGHTALMAIDPVTGFLITPASPAQDGLHPVDLAVDPSGRFLYVANNGSNNVSLMKIDPVTGLLTIGTPKACGLAPSAILVTGITQ